MSSDDETQIKELPYGVDYAKSGRASCKICKRLIAKDALRMSVRFPSHRFDGIQDNWHHFNCFWKRVRKCDINETSIRGMEWIKWEDQVSIRQKIAEIKAEAVKIPLSHIPKADHAKSSVGKCHQCKEKMMSGELRIMLKSSFYHPACLEKLKAITDGAENIVGFDELDDDEKATLTSLFPKAELKRKADENGAEKSSGGGDQPSGSGIKRAKIDQAEALALMKKQTDTLFKYRQMIVDNLHKDEVEEILLANGHTKLKHDSLEKRIETLVDLMVFGVSETCTQCSGGTLRYCSTLHSYHCTGSISEFTRCTYADKNPPRHPIKIPKDLRKQHDFLEECLKPCLKERIYSAIVEEEKVVEKSSLHRQLESKQRWAMSEMDFESGYFVKNGCVIDDDCGVDAHVYVDPETKMPWQATLGATDMQIGRNSYYKMQLLEDDNSKEYYFYRSWGRIGTLSGGKKTEEFGLDLDGCKAKFKEMFFDKTKNDWDNVKQFKKHPFGMNLIEVEYDGQNDSAEDCMNIEAEKSESKLPFSIKSLIEMIFDIKTMNQTLEDYNVDIDKLPLGELTRRQILSAYEALSDVQKLLEHTDPPPPAAKFLDASNKFYTLIPHNTGQMSPPLLNNAKIVKEKADMLENLLDLHASYQLIKSKKKPDFVSKDSIDVHYEKLKCSIEELDKQGAEFALIKKYLHNTHSKKHDAFKLKIVDVFKVDREGESDRFKRDIGNCHLLWHGSRTSNYGGILSQGLLMPPKEAPSTGSMFGKGIYMADMVSKSANYCRTYHDTDGLLILCEAALGNMLELKQAKCVTKLENGKNSVKGVGLMTPNPKKAVVTEDGVTVPCGTPINSKQSGLSLQHNEYIVYDEAQVRMKYLVRAKFTFK